MWPPLTEQRLQTKLDAARQRLRQIVVPGLKSWLPEVKRKELAKIEGYARGQVRVHHRLLLRFRAEQRPRQAATSAKESEAAAQASFPEGRV